MIQAKFLKIAYLQIDQKNDQKNSQKLQYYSRMFYFHLKTKIQEKFMPQVT